MPQQINLYAATLRRPQVQFGAKTMAMAFGAVVLSGLVGAAAWVLNLESTIVALQTAGKEQLAQAQSLQSAIDKSKADAQSAVPVLQKELQDKQAALAQKELFAHALQDGLVQPGSAHSDRLTLIARTIPDTVWINAVKADKNRMEIDGFTYEPSALNDWVARLSLSPLMSGLRLSSVNVQSVAAQKSLLQTGNSAAIPAMPAATPMPDVSGREAWSFHLLSAQPQLSQQGAKP